MAIKVLDRDGNDHISIDVTIDDGATSSTDTGLIKGVTMIFDAHPDLQQMSFNDQVKIRIIQFDDFVGRVHNTGMVLIVAGEVGLGERTQQFTCSEAHYELTYEVAPA